MNLFNNRLAILLSLGLVLAVAGCSAPVEKEEYWMSYDDIGLMNSPSDTAVVVKSLHGRVSPFVIVGRDSTGEWGCYALSTGVFSKRKTGWLPLKEMTYAGSNDTSERYEAYVVKPKELPLYKHPKVDKKDNYVMLHQGDTILATEKKGNWLHIYYTRFGRTGHQTEDYGWVQTAQLQRIDSLTRDGLRERKLATSVTAQANEREDASYLESRQKNHKAYQTAGTIVGYIAIVVALALVIPAIRRKKMWDVVLILVAGILILGLWQAIPVSSWWLAFLIPLMAYAVTYPLLYFNSTSRIFLYAFPVLALLAASGYLIMNTNVLHPTFWRVVWFVILAGICVVETFAIRNRREKDVCPHCGFYAKHVVDGREQTGSTSSFGTEKKDEYINTTREKRGNTEYITEHYNRVTYDTKKTTRFYDVHRTCMHCGLQFDNFEESTVTTRTRR